MNHYLWKYIKCRFSVRFSRLRKLVLLFFIFALGENRQYNKTEINNNIEYMGTLCRNFGNAFQQQMQPPRKKTQYAVLTLGLVNNIPPRNFNFATLPLQNPSDNWNAWYTGLRNDNDRRHLEYALLNSVSLMLQAHIDRRIAQTRNLKVTHLNQLLPLDMYLYTYLIPCLDKGHECTYVILNAVNTNISDALIDILSQPQYSKILSDTVNKNLLFRELSEMTFWLGWTSNEWGTTEKQQKTFNIFTNRQNTRPNPTALSFRHFRVYDECTIQRDD